MQFHGIVGYLLTPFDADSKVDTDRLADLTEDMVSSGVNGVAPLGSAGLLPLLSDEERDTVVDVVCRKVAGRVPVLVGTSSMTTAGAIRHARYAERAGAAAISLAPWAYWKLSETEVMRHFDAVASAIGLPIMVYNNPASGTDMSTDLIVKLAEISNVTMLKESTGDLTRIQSLLSQASCLDVFIGKNTLSFAALALGCRGWCSAAAQVAPWQLIAMYDAIVDKSDLALGRNLYREMLPLLEALVRGGLPRTVPAALELLGKGVGRLRDPIKPVEEAERAIIKRALHQLRLL